MNLFNLSFRGKPIFYGWVIVFGLGLVTMVSMGMLGINFGLFIEPISRELDIGQSFFGWAQSARLLGSAASGFILGRILDRYGARWPMVFAGILVCGVMIMMSNISEGWQVVAIFLVMGLLGLQGGGGNLYTVVSISNWFVQKRSQAMSRVFLGTSIGILIFAPLTAYLIEHIGWRNANIILGIVGAMVVVIVALLIRRTPGDIGQSIDGISTKDIGADPTASSETETQEERTEKDEDEYSWTRKEALRSPAFWKISLAFGLAAFANGTVQLFRVPHFVSRGIDPQIVAYSLSFEALVVLAVIVPVGYLATRYRLRYILIGSQLVRVIVVLVMFTATHAWQAFLANGLFGVAATSQMIIMSIIYPNYFGKANIGSIRGLALPVTTALSFAGAPFAGIVFDIYGTYELAWIVAIACAIIASILFLVTPKPASPVRYKNS
jgi:predicted MFS family arabinose efflux permease